MGMKRKRVILISKVSTAAALMVAAIAVLPVACDRVLKARLVGREHVYELSERPRYLTEDMAIAKARETLARDGFDINAWRLLRADRSLAAEDRADEYFVRNTKNPNAGVFTVQDATGSRRFVHVELDGAKVSSRVVIPK
jgi:hypothetical protein